MRWESIAFGAPGDRRCRTALIDVTAARKSQREREESEERYRRLTDALTDHVYRVRLCRRPVEVTHGGNCEAVTGYTAEELAAHPGLWIAMVPPEDCPAVERQTAGIPSGRDAPPLEHRIRRKDGTIRWVLNTTSLERDQKGRVVAYDGLLRDITPGKRAEEALQKLNEELEHRVAERTAELAAANEVLRAAFRPSSPGGGVRKAPHLPRAPRRLQSASRHALPRHRVSQRGRGSRSGNIPEAPTMGRR